MTASQPEADEIPEKLQTIKEDESKALRAEKELGDEAHPDAKHIDTEPRTAVRFSHITDGVASYDIVHTRITAFPLGIDSYSTYTQDTVADWVRKNDPEIIDASDEQWEES